MDDPSKLFPPITGFTGPSDLIAFPRRQASVQGSMEEHFRAARESAGASSGRSVKDLFPGSQHAAGATFPRRQDTIHMNHQAGVLFPRRQDSLHASHQAGLLFPRRLESLLQADHHGGSAEDEAMEDRRLLGWIREGDSAGADFQGFTVARVEELLAASPIDLNLRDGVGNTALHNLCRLVGSASMAPEGLAIVKLLISRGADVNANGWSISKPLHCAAKVGHAPLVELLVKSGANVNAVDAYGFAALHYVASLGSVECAAQLIVRADKSLTTKKGESALQIAERHKHQPVIQMLTPLRAPPNPFG